MTERSAGAPLKTYGGPERRQQARLDGPFRVRVTGVDSDGNAFDVEALADNVSAGGFYVRLPRGIQRGARLSATILLPKTTGRLGRDNCLAAHGRVLRSEVLTDGTSGAAVEFANHLFL
ncbi:MAG TPA: PilZ domain-containing protein [Pyrinomonadaceae bacterium]|nr:PilZ domain-containing protein [Pyrinomonadaceae bacterium]